jgi:hypothetical protein
MKYMKFVEYKDCVFLIAFCTAITKKMCCSQYEIAVFEDIAI